VNTKTKLTGEHEINLKLQNLREWRPKGWNPGFYMVSQVQSLTWQIAKRWITVHDQQSARPENRKRRSCRALCWAWTLIQRFAICHVKLCICKSIKLVWWLTSSADWAQAVCARCVCETALSSLSVTNVYVQLLPSSTATNNGPPVKRTPLSMGVANLLD